MSIWSDSSKIRLTNHKKGDGTRSFLIELCQKNIIFLCLKIFQHPEAVAMLVSFPTNVQKLGSEEDIPSYDRFSEKRSKTSKNPKINKVIHLADRWNIPQQVTASLAMKVSDCISNGNWCIPEFVVHKDVELALQISNITLPMVGISDKLCWTAAFDGELTNKIAFKSLNGSGQKVSWASLLWNTYIPPSRSFIPWRLLHMKLPTDENLRKRGCTIVSMCGFCLQAAESSHHIFFECPVTSKLWEWLGKGSDQVLNGTNCLQILTNRVGPNSKLVHQTMNSVVVHTLWAIWIERNQWYFHSKQQPMSTLFNIVLAEVNLSYKLSLVKGESSMLDYKVAKLFNIPLKANRVIPSIDVVWSYPSEGFIKFNCDGSSVGSQPCGSVGVVIRDSLASFLGAISSNIGYATPLEAEFRACMLAIEKAKELHLTNICLETDSLRVVTAYNKGVGIPWQMRARWINCKHFCDSIICTCVHVLREGNMVADALAKHGQGLSMHSTQWWPSAPPFLHQLLARDSLGLPFFRSHMT